MSITVVSIPPTPNQGPVADSGNGSDVAAVQDFANLLQGQLASNTEPSANGTGIPGAAADLPVAATDLANTASETAAAAPIDAAALLAALGLAATPSDAKPADKAAAEGAESGITPTDAAASTLAALGLAATPAAKAPVETDHSAQQAGTGPLSAVAGDAGSTPLTAAQGEPLKTEAVVAAAAGSDEKAAKFAVASTPTDSTVSADTVLSDATATAVVQTSGNAPTHTNHAQSKSDSSLSVSTHVRDKAWATDLGQKVVWLASNEKQSAQLTLNPPQMGPIEVSVDVDKGNASVSFVSANAEVREALETALPRLREMFASAGIELGQTNVGAQSFSQQQAWNGEQNQSSSRWLSDNAILAADTTGSLATGALTVRQGNGMVDIFA